jgi:hypothetical protein
MPGPLALLIALVSYGNVYLNTAKSAYTLDFNNSTLIYNTSITFSDTTLSATEKAIATDPQQWFAFLKKSGCVKLKLAYHHSKELQMKDYESAGFVGGGGVWQIETVYNDHSDYWSSEDIVANENDTAKRIWSTRLKISAKAQLHSKLEISIETAKTELAASLNKITAFANDHKVEEWAKVFEKATKTLNDSKPVFPYGDAIINGQYPLQKMQLLCAAAEAYVFGGMGSWNDISYSSDKEEKTNAELSADLYDKVNNAILTAINK